MQRRERAALCRPPCRWRADAPTSSELPVSECCDTISSCRDGCSVLHLGRYVMRSSFGFAVPSVVATLSAVLLCSTTAMSQATPNSTLPAVSVEAPKARPTVVPRQGPTTVTTSHHRATGSSSAQNPQFAPGSALWRLAKLEREARSCNGGCETSFRVGNAPWIGCSLAGQGGVDGSMFSPTCTDTLSYNTYAQCVETKAFLGAQPRESRWLCSSLLAGGKLPGEKRVAEQLGRR